MSQLVIKINGTPLAREAETPVEVIEEVVTKPSKGILIAGSTAVATLAMSILSNPAFADTLNTSVATQKMQEGFSQLYNVGLTLAQPVLWFYALTGCVMMVTGKNRDKGIERLKNCGYGYIAIQMIPTFFSFMGMIASMLNGAVHVGG